jgi:hypothetical protein
MTTTTPSIAITFYVDGKQIINRFDLSDPQWRKSVQALKEFNKPFRIVYL